MEKYTHVSEGVTVELANMTEKEARGFKNAFAIIDEMTPEERRLPKKYFHALIALRLSARDQLE